MVLFHCLPSFILSSSDSLHFSQPHWVNIPSHLVIYHELNVHMALFSTPLWYSQATSRLSPSGQDAEPQAPLSFSMLQASTEVWPTYFQKVHLIKSAVKCMPYKWFPCFPLLVFTATSPDCFHVSCLHCEVTVSQVVSLPSQFLFNHKIPATVCQPRRFCFLRKGRNTRPEQRALPLEQQALPSHLTCTAPTPACHQPWAASTGHSCAASHLQGCSSALYGSVPNTSP